MSFSEYLLYMVEPVEMLRKERSVNVEYEKHEKKTWKWIFSSLEFDFIEAKMWLTHFILFFIFIVWSKWGDVTFNCENKNEDIIPLGTIVLYCVFFA